MFYVSAGVYASEKNLSQVIANISSTSAAIVGPSPKGSLTAIKTITSNQAFLQEYGNPVPGNWFHYSALAYLAQGKALNVLRVAHSDVAYGGATVPFTSGTVTGFSAGRTGTPAFTEASGSSILFDVYAINPGVWNNSIAIGLRATVSGAGIPSGQDDTTLKNFWVDVYLTTNGVQSKVESFYVSRQTKLNGHGQQMYLQTAINGVSQYIQVFDNASQASTVMPPVSALNQTPVAFLNGADGTTATDADIVGVTNVSGWGLFYNVDTVDFRIAIHGGVGTSYPVIQAAMKSLVEARRDCIAIFDMPYSAVHSTSLPTNVGNMVTYRTDSSTGVGAINSSYTALYGPWVTIYDPYSGQTLAVPPSGFVAAQYAYNDNNAEVWNAPAGMNRGQLSVLSLTSVFDQGSRDTLYTSPVNINPLQTFNGQGNVIWGQKTMSSPASALDRVNVRRMLIILEKSISAALVGFVFENNNLQTRTRITAMINSYLATLNAGGAFTTVNGKPGYQVVCDESNNTPAIIDQHIIAVDVFVKPAQTGEFVQLQTVITTSGASFNELIAQGV